MYNSYKVFYCYAYFDDADNGINERVELNNASSVGIGNVAISRHVGMYSSFSGPCNNGCASKCRTSNFVNFLKILEDVQCFDYVLQKKLQCAYNAKLQGFNFNPKATTATEIQNPLDIQSFEALTSASC